MSVPLPTTITFPAGVLPFEQRKFPKTICMFDVDGTLSLARQEATPEMFATLKKLREYTAVAFVGGSDLSKILEQVRSLSLFDYGFAENGLVAYKLEQPLAAASFIKHVGEEEYKKMVNWILRYLSDVDIPIKRGTFIEFRNGMINVSPIGRNASIQERIDFEKYDKEHGIRAEMVKKMEQEFVHLGLTFAIGGQISFDIFPQGWDKTYSLKHVEPEGFDTIHFFGDKTFKGGNDYEIFSDPRVTGHTVTSPEDTMRQLDELFLTVA
ncbi:phosphomannomutase [Kwoniella mangroviensis CBS 10435]|uniref:Phosphomannomutase n=1 Tax=Kwoniella mangroviensis CBS 10435 TaxID=1331196 RepID=A0A1B9IV50_9TREE|nr:phosphomannomutase [Kwoniella mangroviensis CBS 10435]